MQKYETQNRRPVSDAAAGGGGAAPRPFRDPSEASPCTFNDNLRTVFHHLMLE